MDEPAPPVVPPTPKAVDVRSSFIFFYLIRKIKKKVISSDISRRNKERRKEIHIVISRITINCIFSKVKKNKI